MIEKINFDNKSISGKTLDEQILTDNNINQIKQKFNNLIDYLPDEYVQANSAVMYGTVNVNSKIIGEKYCTGNIYVDNKLVLTEANISAFNIGNITKINNIFADTDHNITFFQHDTTLSITNNSVSTDVFTINQGHFLSTYNAVAQGLVTVNGNLYVRDDITGKTINQINISLNNLNGQTLKHTYITNDNIIILEKNNTNKISAALPDFIKTISGCHPCPDGNVDIRQFNNEFQIYDHNTETFNTIYNPSIPSDVGVTSISGIQPINGNISFKQNDRILQIQDKNGEYHTFYDPNITSASFGVMTINNIKPINNNIKFIQNYNQLCIKDNDQLSCIYEPSIPTNTGILTISNILPDNGNINFIQTVNTLKVKGKDGTCQNIYIPNFSEIDKKIETVSTYLNNNDIITGKFENKTLFLEKNNGSYINISVPGLVTPTDLKNISAMLSGQDILTGTYSNNIITLERNNKQIINIEISSYISTISGITPKNGNINIKQRDNILQLEDNNGNYLTLYNPNFIDEDTYTTDYTELKNEIITTGKFINSSLDKSQILLEKNNVGKNITIDLPKFISTINSIGPDENNNIIEKAVNIPTDEFTYTGITGKKTVQASTTQALLEDCYTKIANLDTSKELIGKNSISFYIDNINGSDTNDGLTADNAFKTIEHAIQNANKYRFTTAVNMTFLIMPPTYTFDIILGYERINIYHPDFSTASQSRIYIQSADQTNKTTIIGNIQKKSGDISNNHLLIINGCNCTICNLNFQFNYLAEPDDNYTYMQTNCIQATNYANLIIYNIKILNGIGYNIEASKNAYIQVYGEIQIDMGPTNPPGCDNLNLTFRRGFFANTNASIQLYRPLILTIRNSWSAFQVIKNSSISETWQSLDSSTKDQTIIHIDSPYYASDQSYIFSASQYGTMSHIYPGSAAYDDNLIYNNTQNGQLVQTALNNAINETNNLYIYGMKKYVTATPAGATYFDGKTSARLDYYTNNDTLSTGSLYQIQLTNLSAYASDGKTKICPTFANVWQDANSYKTGFAHIL